VYACVYLQYSTFPRMSLFIHSNLWQTQQCRRYGYSQSSRRISSWSCSPSTTW